MLLELHISDFAIIDRLSLSLNKGFNVLTGETGAGKSIIIDALGTLRGERVDPAFVRTGSERARIEGIFSIDDRPDIVPLLREYGLADDDDEGQLILTREVNRESGRSVARINGRAVNSAVLREIGGRLIEIHGQHDGLQIFNPRYHADLLDRYGNLLPLRDRITANVAALRQVRDELARLRQAAANRADRLQELRLLIEDVTNARIRVGEEEELLQERSLIQNSARLTDSVNKVYTLLYAGDESDRRTARPIVESLGIVVATLEELTRVDPHMERSVEQARELLYAAEDLSAVIRTYRDTLDFDPERLDEIEDRLTLIRDLQRKHRGSIEHMLQRAESATIEIERLLNSEEHMSGLEAHEQRLLEEIGQQCGLLSLQRHTIGAKLAAAVEGAVRELAMPHVQFAVSIDVSDDPHGVPVALPNEAVRRLAFDRTGVDRVEFLFSPNPGEPLKPLVRIASGGESARILLALKSILSRVDEVPTLIFDEVDVGVGGRAGQVVGEKLWSISDYHQVMCITHLPQVATFADAHYAISKQVSSNRTKTFVHHLDDDQRIDEIAAMLDGLPVSEHGRRIAREMIDRARWFKEQTVREMPAHVS